MNKKLEEKMFADWRRSEAYCVPVTEEGMVMAQDRYLQFQKGWIYGLKRAILEMETKHRENKHQHNYYLFMANDLRALLKGDNK